MGRTKLSMRGVAKLLCALALLLLATSASAADKKLKLPSNDDCLACHQDASLSHDVNGKSVSLAVDPDKFKNSIHGGMFTCVDCHDDLKEAPHTSTPAKVSCSKCHADQDAAYKHGIHATALRAKAPGSKESPSCTSC